MRENVKKRLLPLMVLELESKRKVSQPATLTNTTRVSARRILLPLMESMQELN